MRTANASSAKTSIIRHAEATRKKLLPASVNFAFFLGQDTDMSLVSFVQAHAAHADWRVALAQCQRQLKAQISARAAQCDSAPFTLGWSYLSDYYAPAAEAILDELRLCFPGVSWVGTFGKVYEARWHTSLLERGAGHYQSPGTQPPIGPP